MASQAHNKPGFWPETEDTAPVTYLPVAATQTLAKGDPVYLSSGLVTVMGVTTATCCGVMAQASVLQASGTLVAVWGATNHQVFIARQDGDASSVVAGTLIDLAGSTGAFELDTSNSTYDIFTAIAKLPDDAVATADNRWRVIINPAVLSLHL